MTCPQFEQIFMDLARTSIADSGIAEGALDHAQSCPRCAAQLSDQRKLSVALRAMSAAARNEQAPERVEHALLSAWRMRFGTSPPATAGRGGSRPVARRLWAAGRTAPTPWRVRTVAVASLMLLALVVAWKLRPTSPVRPEERAASSTVTSRKAGVAAVDEQTRAAPVVVPRLVSSPRPTPKHEALSKRVATPETAAAETTTRFYPLPYGSGLGLEEGWVLVRVQVRRSSLASLGVPASEGAATGDMLTADVVVGQDGLARGIRFVE